MTFLTVDQVAELLQVSSRTVARWAERDSSFPATRLGRTVRIESSALDRWLAARTQRRAQRSTSALAPVA